MLLPQKIKERETWRNILKKNQKRRSKKHGKGTVNVQKRVNV
jgi:hypothetical protein